MSGVRRCFRPTPNSRDQLDKCLVRDSGVVGGTPECDDILPGKSTDSQRLEPQRVILESLGGASASERADGSGFSTLRADPTGDNTRNSHYVPDIDW